MKLSDKSIVPEKGNGCKEAMNNCLVCVLKEIKPQEKQNQPSQDPLSAIVIFCDDFHSHWNESLSY